MNVTYRIAALEKLAQLTPVPVGAKSPTNALNVSEKCPTCGRQMPNVGNKLFGGKIQGVFGGRAVGTNALQAK